LGGVIEGGLVGFGAHDDADEGDGGMGHRVLGEKG
jgi:hypothetical protein